MKIKTTFTLASLATTFILTASLFYFYEIKILFAYLVSINCITLTLYCIDKISASSKKELLRIPERTLHILALAGGSPAALLGQKTFRHKTQKKSFLTIYFCIVLLQIGLILWYVYATYTA